ncbi:MAG: right-handed parallel beta-helix repeat-containing protein [Ferruginibacter sp.]
MKIRFLILYILLIPIAGNSQGYIIRSIKYFGAKGNGISDDQDAFKKASEYFNKRKGNGKLVIPKGIYIIGRQKFTGNDIKKNTASYTCEYALDIRNCNNFFIEGKPGAVLKTRDSLRIGTFSPVTGKPYKHEIRDINVKQGFGHYPTTVGITIYVLNSSNINISGLRLDGNFEKFILGGNWGNGRNAYELIHYGIYLIDTHDVTIRNCSIYKFACDGIYIANLGKEVKTYKISVDNCKVNYCGRNGLSWLGGDNIRVTNSEFSNAGKGLIHESPAAGIDIEVENNSFCRNGFFYNCKMINNTGSGITSGSAKLSSNVMFKRCTVASPGYYTVFADAASHVFVDCKLYGTVLVWYRASKDSDAVKFIHCTFEENYRGKKMYDGSYQLGIEGTAAVVDSCTFKAYTTANYYLKGLTDDCSNDNKQKIRISNNRFYSYANEIKLAPNTAGIAGHTVFNNNRFYALPGVVFQNGFNGNCNADAGGNKFYEISRVVNVK